jgi:DNA ligase (NAD+)
MAQVDYPIDGMVAEVTDEDLRAHMGATAHHYRWQIAIKTRGETAVTTVEDIHWQVGRTGNLTPVLQVAPVSLSGATIRRVTAHHAGMVKAIRPGRGARIEIIRSGEVIPKIERVIEPSDDFTIPEECPSCAGPLTWQNDFLKCRNPACRAQAGQRIRYWFQTLGTADWFGIKTVQKLVAAGYDTLEKIYDLRREDFEKLGFGPVQSRNLAEALELSRTKPVEDWRFLAAFGIADLGKGESRRLLTFFPLKMLPQVKAGDIEKIHGFGKKTSESITGGLAAIGETFRHMLALGFNLQETPLAGKESGAESPVAGKGIVFTGRMQGGSREEMQARARRLGARVQSAVSGKTDYLVCGQKVGRTKLDKARRLGVTILGEDEYRKMIAGEGPAGGDT